MTQSELGLAELQREMGQNPPVVDLLEMSASWMACDLLLDVPGASEFLIPIDQSNNMSCPPAGAGRRKAAVETGQGCRLRPSRRQAV